MFIEGVAIAESVIENKAICGRLPEEMKYGQLLIKRNDGFLNNRAMPSRQYYFSQRRVIYSQKYLLVDTNSKQ